MAPRSFERVSLLLGRRRNEGGSVHTTRRSHQQDEVISGEMQTELSPPLRPNYEYGLSL